MVSSPGYYPLVIIQGATLGRTFTWKDSSNQPIAFPAGWKGRAQGRTSYTSPDKIFDLNNTGLGGIVLGATDGTISMTIAASATALMNFDEAVWDLELEDPTGVVTRLLKGPLTLDREATK